MKRDYSPHYDHKPSREQRRARFTAPPKIGHRAVAHTTIIVSSPGHVIGLQKDPEQTIFDSPDYFGSTRGEVLASSILDSAGDGDSSNRHSAGEVILQSIDVSSDSRAITSLKQISAAICRVRHVSPDYEQIIEALDDTLTADELRDFVGHVYEWSHENPEDTETYVNDVMTTLSGYRVEASFERLAQAAGFTVKQATHQEDHRGIDFYVNDVPFDIKSSEKTAILHTNKHKNDTRRYHTVKFVPSITLADFAGRLIIPNENVEHILASTGFQKTVKDAIVQFIEANS